MTLSLCLSGNEPRQRYLFEALNSICNVRGVISFDDISPVSKYLAAALSFSLPRSEWWESYQLHPVMQRARRARFIFRLESIASPMDAVLMWGSWFHPFTANYRRSIPYFHYIDQSRS